jgi:hypothetical protein
MQFFLSSHLFKFKFIITIKMMYLLRVENNEFSLQIFEKIMKNS